MKLMKLTLYPYTSDEKCSGSNCYCIKVISHPGCTSISGNKVKSIIV